MNAIERKTLYFLKEGEANTDALLKFVKAYAEAAGVNHIVVASTSGETGVKASEVFKSFNVVVVTHHAGFAEPGVHELAEKNRLKILKNGAPNPNDYPCLKQCGTSHPQRIWNNSASRTDRLHSEKIRPRNQSLRRSHADGNRCGAHPNRPRHHSNRWKQPRSRHRPTHKTSQRLKILRLKNKRNNSQTKGIRVKT